TVEPEGVGSSYMGSSDYAVFTRQLEEYGNEQIWCAALVDKACNIYSRYCNQTIEDPSHKAKILTDFSRYKHLGNVLYAKATSLGPDVEKKVKIAYGLFSYAWAQALHTQTSITNEEIDEALQKIYVDVALHQQHIDQDLAEYHALYHPQNLLDVKES
ncbi:hypothetical protein KAZ66_05930, partial [Candidatus Woesebacteria bacterium]|nr:hypothetical protein [Candidatus Woesebacteria bacterium]